jgi:hypothetical protein
MPVSTTLSPLDRLKAAITRRFPGYEYQDMTGRVTNEREPDAIVWLPFVITPIGADPWDSDPEKPKPGGIVRAGADTTDTQTDLEIEGMLEHLEPLFAECYGER